MSEYKFVTREEVLALWRPDVPRDAIKTLNRLFSERDAYREVAINQVDLYDFHSSKEEAYAHIDAEASRIMEGK